jgi:iron complex transport system substrate-binding protein
VFAALRQIGALTGRTRRAAEVTELLQARIRAVSARSAAVCTRPRVALLEWLDPPFSCGHWTPELVELAGGTEGLGRVGEPSRTLPWDDVFDWRPEVIVLACCGYTIEQTLVDARRLHALPGWNELPAVRGGRVYVTDGSQYFSRPGPRLVDSLEILAHVILPDVHSRPPEFPLSACRVVSD